MANKEIAVSVKDLYKDFEMASEKRGSFKEIFVNIGKRSQKQKQHVLRGVSFEIEKGDFFGIVGRNGSGKSTLLKILAGVYEPSKGDVVINGDLTPFIELGVGFNPELSGRDNVYLNGALLGFDRKKMQELYKSVVDFAELHDAMDKKLKNYSSGMQVRLAFSIAVKARRDILIFDEVLAVGDINFQRKCFDYFTELKQSGQTVIFVSHDRAAVERYCNKAILIEDGKIVESRSLEKVFEKYDEINSLIQKKEMALAKDIEIEKNKSIRSLETGLKIQNTRLVSKDGIVNSSKSSVSIEMEIYAQEEVVSPIYGVIIKRRNEPAVLTISHTGLEGVQTSNLNKGTKKTIKFDIQNIFPNGHYQVTFFCAKSGVDDKYYDWLDDAIDFEIVGRKEIYVPVYINNKISEK